MDDNRLLGDPLLNPILAAFDGETTSPSPVSTACLR
jgi:hypothetical protein